jgi:two-component system LytT family response regulator
MNTSLKPGISCLIADDYEIDRLTVVAQLRKYPFITISGTYDNATKALAAPAAATRRPALPGYRHAGAERPGAPLTLYGYPCMYLHHRYPDYAVEAFDAAALDFLIKPITSDRFEKAIRRVQEFFEVRQKAELFEHSLGNDTIFIKEGHEKTKVRLHDILYLEALRDYTTIVTLQKKYHVLTTLGNLLNENEFSSFIRIHRSFAVQRHYVRKLDTRTVYLENISLPLGKAYKTDIEKIFN